MIWHRILHTITYAEICYIKLFLYYCIFWFIFTVFDVKKSNFPWKTVNPVKNTALNGIPNDCQLTRWKCAKYVPNYGIMAKKFPALAFILASFWHSLWNQIQTFTFYKQNSKITSKLLHVFLQQFGCQNTCHFYSFSQCILA